MRVSTIFVLIALTWPAGSPALGNPALSRPAVGNPAVGSPALTKDDVLWEIDLRYRAGVIDERSRHLYRVALIKDPSVLPADLQVLAAQAIPAERRSLTYVFREAWRWVVLNGAQGGAIHELLLPPDDLANVLESTTWPIRVSYSSSGPAALAQRTLTAAEYSWSVQTQWGFYQPPIEPGADMYRFYITDASGAGGYTAPYDENPATTITDCFTYIVIDPSNGEWETDGTVAHEVNHSMQAAMDCTETIGFWENTATYIMGQVYPQQVYYTIGIMPYFQAQPWRALDYMNQNNSDLYEYGGGLFVWYLADTFAPNDGPWFVAEIWEASIGTNFYNNEPDYYDGIEAAVAARGGTETMEDILIDFSESRFFVGSWSDGAHINGAGQFWDAEVELTARHPSAALPVRDAQPPMERRPAPYGSNQILVDLNPSDQRPIQVRFDGEDDTRWAVRVVLFGSGQSTVSQALPLDETTWDGSVVVEPAGFTGLLLVVANQGDEGYDPDARAWPLAGYVYDVEPVVAPATLAALDPDTVERGQQGVVFRLTGSGFVLDAGFDLAFDDPTIEIGSIDSVTDTEVLFTATLPALTELGPKTILVTNGGGEQLSGVGFLTVVEQGSIGPDGGPGDDNPKSGCGCGTGRGGAGSGASVALPLLLGLLGLLLLVRRRRRCGAR
ncbi:MAG: DUF6055 domain-containing protein [bacterium]